MNNLKQVIVMRKDLNMRKGKMIVQGAHASLWWTMLMNTSDEGIPTIIWNWLCTGMKKICVSVNSLEELYALDKAANEAGLLSYIVTDAGYTEFDGPTETCLAIGPGQSEEIDKITGKLPLL